MKDKGTATSREKPSAGWLAPRNHGIPLATAPTLQANKRTHSNTHQCSRTLPVLGKWPSQMPFTQGLHGKRRETTVSVCVFGNKNRVTARLGSCPRCQKYQHLLQ
ncbi:hypothetical protein ATANTOWER_010367 [Ataeniobius toweri]|uniref:Uncharacterized protein n=1 Tax=Ataeniobius toweri TaxID=208326 RepID=A0ABU7AAF5_9TELE|nr:hypothetical protein [Ataeniobius toweri]